jgi:polyisoprenoid-binding protein YceI
MTKWNLDPAHSVLGFKVKHLMISNVKGYFKNFSVEAETESDDFKNGHVKVNIDATSIDTANEQRDQHLKSSEFLKTEDNAEIKFESTRFEGETLEGNLTIAGQTRPVKLHVEFGGTAKDPWGNTKAGFTISGKINRKDYAITWNAPLETGGVLLGDEVNIFGDIQLQKQG